ncbi:c-type cytochrome [Heliobacterium gestii]|uniref:18 kDa cytochrome c553 n=2 Tax=Heliomicrobium gestii TaxID=2699 RepID=Q9L5A0_HELGE|nr:cytochrome c [Heliomicrobium gestii]AAF68084.1 18 kDa cytochrome c553 [Heliomicrobium gestii]MBM7866411.1 mono/diheme cytochrome c family protein [Heliomicrobium gestii]MZP42805.1 c-type cytochrome [Heliomicrobium gestii]
MKNLKLIGIAAVMGLSMVALTACNSGSKAPDAAKPAPAPSSAPAPAPAPADKPTAAPAAAGADAKALFTGKGACITCHKLGTEGALEVGPNLGEVGKKYNEEKIYKILVNPSGEGLQATMPAATTLSDDEKKAVAKFLAEKK